MCPPADGCPICGKQKATDFAPFCSRRCADIDLGRWLKGGYAIPGRPAGSPENPSEDDPAQDGPRTLDSAQTIP